MDIEIKEVQEIIKNLESSGELSIKEEKYLKVAKLCMQVVAENVGIKGAIHQLKNIDYQNESMNDVTLAEEIGFNAAVMAMYRWVPKTPGYDAIGGGVKADGVDEFSKTLEGAADICGKSKAWEAQENLLDFAERGFDFAKQLREGANHD
jgi:hypothetical protein